MDEKLPLKEIFQRGITMPFGRYQSIFRLGWPYLVLVLVLSVMNNQEGGVLISLLLAVATWAMSVLAVVGCHRVFLMSHEEVRKTRTFRWSHRETNFLFSVIGMGILASLICIPFVMLVIFLAGGFEQLEDGQYMAAPLMALVPLPAYYFISRWSLILPDTALDNDRTFSWAWQQSKPYQWRLFLLVGILPLASSFVIGWIGQFGAEGIVWTIITNLVWMVVLVVEVCMLSLSYEWIMARNPQAPEPDDESLLSNRAPE